MKNVLVVGGAGYIGSHTVFELIENDFSVVVVDDLSTGFEKAIHKDAKFYKGNIKDEEFLNEIFKKEKIDGVIHFAAFSQVGESVLNPLKYYENNVYGTMCLLKSMIKNNVNNIVFSSTAAVYGEPKKVPIEETDEKSPTNCYGETKLAIENMLKWFNNAYGLNHVCFRYFNAAGAHKSGLIGEAHSFETHLIPLVLKVALKQKDYISIFGTDYNTKDKTAVRDYVHVQDLATAHIKALEYLINGGKSDVFNLGSGIPCSVREIINAAKEVTGLNIPVKEEKRREGDPSILTASFLKAKKVLNWEPKHKNIKEIIESAYLWHKNNPEGYVVKAMSINY